MIVLTPEHEKLVEQAMRTGAYNHPDQVITRALEILQVEDEWLQGQRQQIEEKLERAVAQFASGHFFTPDASRADMESRKAKWLADRNP